MSSKLKISLKKIISKIVLKLFKTKFYNIYIIENLYLLKHFKLNKNFKCKDLHCAKLQ